MRRRDGSSIETSRCESTPAIFLQEADKTCRRELLPSRKVKIKCCVEQQQQQQQQAVRWGGTSCRVPVLAQFKRLIADCIRRLRPSRLQWSRI
uniref:Uncharacterized protein n=1 Tax=Perkinsus chesapeaki TaxID=330153 RepID=A7YXP9_PERCH|nr:unknown [Perkinsus chesapeaki]